MLEEIAYRDTWGEGSDSFIAMLYERLSIMRDLLTAGGSLYVHLEPRVNSYVFVAMEEILGKENLVNEIVWKRSDAKSDSNQGSNHYSRIQDTILFFHRSGKAVWKPEYMPLSEEYKASFYRYTDQNGRKYKLENMLWPGGAARGIPFIR